MMNYLSILAFLFILLKQLEAGAWYDDKNMMEKHFNHKLQEQNNQNKEPIVLYAIPHSHDDVGWLTTVEDYFYGSKAQGDYAAVQFTIDTVIQALQQNPDRKFVQVEMGFFTLWWNQQNQEKKEKVKELIKKKQFIIINGGWSQNDEANTYYENIIENMWVGQRFIKNELDFVPTIGWSIDPFGHSSAQSALFQQMGFNGWWFARADYQDKEKRLKDKNMEFIWNPPQASGNEYPTYCSLQYNHYSAPPGFCFDSFCNNDEPIMDDPRLLNYNVDKRAKEFVEYMESMATHYKTNKILHVFGEDFQFTNAEMYFKNLDRLFDYINKNSDDFNGFTVKYATPQEYLDDLSSDDIKLPEQTYDFFPYADNSESYWTGYFTSRVAGKGGIRQQSKLFYSLRTYLGLLKFYNLSDFCEQNQDEIESSLVTFEQTIGILQHHDAVTGTEKQFVSDDYMYRLQNSTNTLNNVMNQVLHEQVSKLSGIEVDQDFQTYNWNATAIENIVVYEGILAQQDVLMTVYSPQKTKEQIVRFKVPNSHFDIINLQNEQEILDCEVVCPKNLVDSTDCDAYFKSELQGFNLNIFLIQYNSNPEKTVKLEAQEVNKSNGQASVYQLSQTKELTIFKETGFMSYKYCTKNNQVCQEKKINLQYNKYDSYQKDGQKSGAYIFRPNEDTFEGPNPYSEFNKKYIYQGEIVSVANLEGDKTNTWLIFQHLNEDYDKIIEIQTYIKPIDISDKQGKEIVLNLDFDDIKNDDIFYTDSSGLELIERKLNYRPTWNLTVTQPASGNYYPINAMIQIRDQESKKHVTLLNDRAQGGTSLQEEQLEIMIHRRCLYDDARGVGEALNETNPHNDLGLVQKVRHWVVLGNGEEDQELPRTVQFNNDLEPITYFAKLFQKVKNVSVDYNNMDLTNSLDGNLKLYLRYYGSKSNTFLMRLNNLNEYSSVDYFANVGEQKETTLTANQLLSDWEKNRIKWQYESNSKQEKLQEIQKIKTPQFYKNPQIDMKPLQFRTFNITPPADDNQAIFN